MVGGTHMATNGPAGTLLASPKGGWPGLRSITISSRLSAS